MKILTYEKWKQLIVFDNVMYKDTKRYSLTLNQFEREIMDAEINFYRNHFSVLQVMNHFKKLKSKTDKETFIKAVLKRQDKILYLPNMLKSHFIKLAKTTFAEHKDFFLILINKACNMPVKNPMPKLFKKVLGGYYSKVLTRLNRIRRVPEIPLIKKALKPEAFENTARDHIGRLQNDLRLATMYGRSSIRKTIPISIVDDYGYGEWISKKVTYNNDRFFLYSNNNKLSDVQLKHMVCFNVYPGYAHFYNTVFHDLTSSTCFDNGATLLINGWAMYAMCHNEHSAYSQNYLIEGCNIAHHLLNPNLEKGYEDAYIYLLGKYTKAQAIDYMLDYTQYIGHYLTYVLGELAIECVLATDFAATPIELLYNLSTINCGDYFALYSPKMQKKIAKNTITGKVIPKYSK